MIRLILLTALTLAFTTSIVAASESTRSSSERCYSAYHLQQKLDLKIRFGDSLNQQHTEVDIDIHVREIPTAESYLKFAKDNVSDGKWQHLRSYVVLIKPNFSKSNGVEDDISERYSHPFVAVVNSVSGEILDLISTEKDKAIMNEYVSFFDMFQYSTQVGNYEYQNGNGYYSGRIVKVTTKPLHVLKSNQGYLVPSNKVKAGLDIIKSAFSINLAKSSAMKEPNCFYQKGSGVESFTSRLSKQSSVSGHAKIKIVADNLRKLASGHTFFDLSSDLSAWPSFSEIKTISKKQALEKLPILLARLESILTDEAKFIEAMLANSEVWPYLADYIQESGIPNDLSLQLFWSLDRIDNSDSVAALVTLVAAPLNSRDHFRSVMALGSTSAPLDDTSVERLDNQLATFSDPENVQDSKLTFVRTLGAIASNRETSDSVHSQQLRQILYSKANSFSEPVNAAVIDAIGNLGNSIDDEGIELLMQATNDDSNNIRLSATSAFARLPYKPEYSEKFISQLANESSIEVKSSIVKIFAKADRMDLDVKQKLLTEVKNTANSSYENNTLKSLKAINFTYDTDEIKILESRLRSETNKENRKLLASLILKHRRQQ